MNRGRRRQQVFHEAAYYETFLECLKEAHIQFGLEVHAYCLMGNHYHLLLRTPRGTCVVLCTMSMVSIRSATIVYEK
ncbi:MAG: transposase [Candidatus Thiodiazotropha sp. (ex Lucinoma annulata)]|nr:transposase [Candidatus Thiodiazotropha sp. (ex Lucinoma annulata)]